MAENFYYDLLGVSDWASVQDIENAYHQQSQRWHPSNNFGNEYEASRRLEQLHQAYMTLADPNRRQAYDELRNNGYFRQSLREHLSQWGGQLGSDPTRRDLNYNDTAVRIIYEFAPSVLVFFYAVVPGMEVNSYVSRPPSSMPFESSGRQMMYWSQSSPSMLGYSSRMMQPNFSSSWVECPDDAQPEIVEHDDDETQEHEHHDTGYEHDHQDGYPEHDHDGTGYEYDHQDTYIEQDYDLGQ